MEFRRVLLLMLLFLLARVIRLVTKAGVKTRKQALEKLENLRENRKVEKNLGQFSKIRVLVIKRL